MANPDYGVWETKELVGLVETATKVVTEATTELLRRMSAGNPQGEKVQITQDDHCGLSPNHDSLCAEPERSDGRIHGEGLPTCASVPCDRVTLVSQPYCCPPCYYRQGPHTQACDDDEAMREAQRSVGRIQAGSEQPEAQKCPDALLPDGDKCPRCGGRRGPSGVDGGSWVHY